MANIIKIKRSATTATPETLAEGELAYSENSGNLFIGINAGADVSKIGGNTDVLKLVGIQAGAQVNVAEVNDLGVAVTWANIPIENVPTGTTSLTVALGDHNHSAVYQPLDTDLTNIAALTSTSGFLKTDGNNVWTVDTSTYLTSITAESLTDLSDVVAGSPLVVDQVLAWDGTNWINATNPVGITDHGLLGGLGDDDHTLYALADGSRGTFATTAQGALADSAMQDLFDDKTPELGANLSVNDFDIVGKPPATSSSDGGDITLTAGAAGTLAEYGGNIDITAGAASRYQARPGSVNITAGAGTDWVDLAGSINITTPNIGTGGGDTGDITLQTGHAGTGTYPAPAGDMVLRTGNGTSGGDIGIYGGAALSEGSLGGFIRLIAGGTTQNNGKGGKVELIAGAAIGTGTANGGDLLLSGGNGAALGGVAQLEGGTGLGTGAGGAVHLIHGGNGDNTGGLVILVSPTSATTSPTLVFREAVTNGTNFVSLKSPDNVETNRTWVLPDDAPVNGEVLQTDGSGNLSFVALAAEANDLTAAVVWDDIPIVNVPTGTTSATVALGDHTHAIYALDNAVVHKTGVESIGGAKTFTDNMVISGDLHVTGTTTTVDSDNTTIADNIISLNYGESGAGVTLGSSGIEVDRGTEFNTRFVWDESTDKWGWTGIDGSPVGTFTPVADEAHTHTGTYQPLDTDLTNIAALTGTAGLLTTDGFNVWSVDTNTYLTSSTVTLDAQANLFAGTGSGAALDGTALNNILFGTNAGNAITSGDDNILFGQSAGKLMANGSDCVAIGPNALQTNVFGPNNIAIGSLALGNVTEGSNVSIGNFSGLNLTGALANVLIGHNAGSAIAAGASHRNICIGNLAGPTGGVTTEKLFIDISQTDTPLIGGDFSANTVTITGTLAATGGVDKLTTGSGAGIVSVAAAAAPSDGQVLTASSSTVASWQTPVAGSIADLSDVVVTGSPGAVTDQVLAFDGTNWVNSEQAAETNDLTAAVTWANVPDTNITESSVIQHVGAIVHDSTSGFDANEHIDHTTVSITAGIGLTGGGTIAASRTVDLDLNSLSTITVTDGASDYAVVYSPGSPTGHQKILVNDLLDGGTF